MTIAQAPGVENMTATVLQTLTNLGFAGLVWYLLAYRDPSRERAIDAERERWLTRMDSHDSLFREAIAQMASEFSGQVTLNTQAMEQLSDEIKELSAAVHHTQPPG